MKKSVINKLFRDSYARLRSQIDQSIEEENKVFYEAKALRELYLNDPDCHGSEELQRLESIIGTMKMSRKRLYDKEQQLIDLLKSF